MVFLVLFAVPAIVVLVAFAVSKGRIDLKEFSAQIAATAAVAGISSLILYKMSVHDLETWNGHVTDKKKVWTSCSHSYSCNCRKSCSGSGSNKTCHRKCDTCHEHTNDWDWNVYSTVGNFTISRVDRRGSNEPPRWTSVNIGEPTSVTKAFTNYIKGAPNTLFKYDNLIERYKIKGILPEYPNKIYDYYRLNRLVVVGGVPVGNQNEWNNELSKLNDRVGARDGANIILVVVKGQDREYFHALSQYWLGGKKNDIVVVANVKDDLSYDWIEVMSWTNAEIFKIQLRDDLMNFGHLDMMSFIRIAEENTHKSFKTRDMEDFAYLKDSITPSVGEFTVALIISILISLGLARWFWLEDPFKNGYRRF